MFVRLSAAIAALSLLTGSALAQGAKPTDPQIAHIAYTAGQIDIEAAKQALAKSKSKEVRDLAQGARPHRGEQTGAGAGQEAQRQAGG